MRQRWPRQARVGNRQLEAYPAPTTDTPVSWPVNIKAVPQGDATASPAGELEGVYIISVAARLLEMHPQTLRKYERLGLIQPVRTVGMLRLYSQDDLRKVMLIRHLMDNLGLNLAGVEFALKLVNNLNVFTRRLSKIRGRRCHGGTHPRGGCPAVRTVLASPPRTNPHPPTEPGTTDDHRTYLPFGRTTGPRKLPKPSPETATKSMPLASRRTPLKVRR